MSKMNKAFSVQEGDIPLLITLPHVGSHLSSYVDSMQQRKNGKKVEALQLLQLAQTVTDTLQRTIGTPFIVIANVHRSIIDFSRRKVPFAGESAYDDVRAEEIYDNFNRSVLKITKQIVGMADKALLLDVHGCMTNEFDAFLGAYHGETAVVSDDRIFGRDDIIEHMSAEGWNVSPRMGEG